MGMKKCAGCGGKSLAHKMIAIKIGFMKIEWRHQGCTATR